ncbi:MAG: hypothetical protein M3Q89_14680 [Verrucomicrobiota bacterium]|nr:hypothetical protein [Verrucomicrobiota bacterium]
MSDNEQKHDEKKVTAATTDAPQEEFISPENIPSHSETPLPEVESERPKPKE